MVITALSPKGCLAWTVLFMIQISPSLADYPCICSYAVETQLYDHPDLNAAVTGSMYEFDCLAQYTLAKDLSSNWGAVMFNHQVGFLEMTSVVAKQTCQGNVPSEDKVTTVVPPTSRLTTTQTTSTSNTTPTTVKPSTTSTSTSSTTTEVISSTTRSTIPTTATVISTSSTISAPTTTTSQTTSTSPTTMSSSTSTRIVTPSPTRTSSTTTSTTTPRPTTTTTTITTTPISTTMRPFTPSTTRSTTTTRRTTPTSTTAATTTQIPTAPHVVTSHATYKPTYKCPDNVLNAALHNHGTVRVQGSTCYELVPVNYQWQDAKLNCRHKGGHLVHIQSMEEERNVMRLLYDSNFKYAVWIGLHDRSYESHFQWISGDPVTFTKWRPGHDSNLIAHHFEDCVVLDPYIHFGFLGSYGLWDDIRCDEPHPWICQHDAVQIPHFNGVTNRHHISFTTKFPVHGGFGNILDLIGRK